MKQQKRNLTPPFPSLTSIPRNKTIDSTTSPSFHRNHNHHHHQSILYTHFYKTLASLPHMELFPPDQNKTKSRRWSQHIMHSIRFYCQHNRRLHRLIHFSPIPMCSFLLCLAYPPMPNGLGVKTGHHVARFCEPGQPCALCCQHHGQMLVRLPDITLNQCF